MRLEGDSRQIYRRIVREIESRLGIGKDRVSLLRPRTKEGILKFQEWLKSLPRVSTSEFEDLKEPELEVKADGRIVYFGGEWSEKLRKLGFLVEVSESEGLTISGMFVRLSSRDSEKLRSELKNSNDFGALSILCPERVVGRILEEKSKLVAVARVLEKAGVEAKAIREVVTEAEKTKEHFEKLKDVSMIEEHVVRELTTLNERIERKVLDFEVTIRGRSILDVMRGDVSSIQLEEVENFIAEQVMESEERLGKLTGIDFSGIFCPSYPVEVNEKKLERAIEEAEREAKLGLYEECRKAAALIAERIKEVRREVELAKDIEFSSVVREIGESFPELANYTGFVGGKHLFIENPQPVMYSVGDSPIAEGRVVILTGANSGGKTSLLELIAQVQIMGQMGLPVKAEKAWIKPFDGLYFFRKKKGVAGAGAFESAVRSFVKAVSSEGTNLILIDEFEAITEPGAAVSIIAELLRVAYEKGHYVVIVSHLGKELKEMLPFARVDGIEAKGLDENFNLIVDRQPMFGRLGRSTPELIIEKMYRKVRSESERGIFRRILESLGSEG